MANTVQKYLALITSEHATKPKYMALVQFEVQCSVDQQAMFDVLASAFDLDTAIGVQLDAVGVRVGITRNIGTPISGVYFSWGTAGVGWGQGNWKGPFDPTDGITVLDDETYRLLLRAKIGLNSWDGTGPSLQAILANIFGLGVASVELWGPGTWGPGVWGGDTNTGTLVFVTDNQNMTITVGVSGNQPSQLFLAILAGGYLPLAAAGVGITGYFVTSVSGSPLFGFGAQNSYISGWGTGAWGTRL